MPRIAKLKRTDAQATARGVGEDANRQFNEAVGALARRFKTVEDLWAYIGPDFRQGLNRLAQDTGVAREQLIQILAEAVREQEPESAERKSRLNFWLQRHWAEALLLTLTLILFGILAAHALTPRDVVAVKADAGLPAFHVVTDDDVIVTKKIGAPGSFTAKSDVVGRFVLKQVSPGTVLTAGQLSTAPLSPGETTRRRLMSIPVKAGAFNAELAPATHVRLLFARRENGGANSAPSVSVNCCCRPCQRAQNGGGSSSGSTSPGSDENSVDDIIVLEINRQGDAASMVIAVNEADITKLTALLGVADVFVTQSMP